MMFNTICEKPPTIYSILDSICNYNADEKTNIYNLSKNGRHKIFDFEYPLYEKINKEEFETMILNKFFQFANQKVHCNSC